ncbi:hypothetical protein CARUB_v10021013mg [Capsella rubella]|uniref:CDP-diacylglycerol--inositol 3-phosphatidyltransferase n=1 Tax=Capsella rubella TaxID=81985 RepID=R0GJ59_9BRAS|nr:hypothetical protein CARUB_v10021013mg [Capsella rubella]
MAKKERPRPQKLSVYLYIPNIVGPATFLIVFFPLNLSVLANGLNSLLFFFINVALSSFCCDAVDGWVARRFNQVSTFGAVLDMVTDSTFLAGKSSHKDVKDSTSWLFRLYYGNRIFMCYCCVSCEVLYIILLLIAKNQSENLLNVVVATLTQISPLSFLLALTLFGWSMKQTVNVIQFLMQS